MAEWAYVENNEIVELHDLLPVSWRNISGLRNAADNIEFLNSVGWYKVNKLNQDYDSNQYKIDSYNYSFANNNVNGDPVLVPVDIIIVNEEEVFREQKNKFMEELRRERDKLLAKSDISQLNDIQKRMTDEEKNLWEVYRQALRDLTALYQDNNILTIQDVTWPNLGIDPL